MFTKFVTLSVTASKTTNNAIALKINTILKIP